jgi:hypothetical protein
MRSFARLALLLVAVAGGGCGWSPPPPPEPAPLHGSEPVDWRAVVGCWRLPDGWVFALDSVPAVLRFVRPRPDARQARSFLPEHRVEDVFWQVTPRNTILFIVDDGLHGHSMEFVPRDGRLVGQGIVLTDIVIEGMPRQRPHEVVAVREPCLADAAEARSQPR